MLFLYGSPLFADTFTFRAEKQVAWLRRYNGLVHSRRCEAAQSKGVRCNARGGRRMIPQLRS